MKNERLWNFVKYLCYLQMSIGMIIGMLIISVKNDLSLGVGILFMGIVGMLLTLLNSINTNKNIN